MQWCGVAARSFVIVVFVSQALIVSLRVWLVTAQSRDWTTVARDMTQHTAPTCAFNITSCTPGEAFLIIYGLLNSHSIV